MQYPSSLLGDARGREAHTRRGSGSLQTRGRAARRRMSDCRSRGQLRARHHPPPGRHRRGKAAPRSAPTCAVALTVRIRCRRAARLCVVTGDVPRGRSARLKRESLGMRRSRRDARSFHSAPHCCVRTRLSIGEPRIIYGPGHSRVQRPQPLRPACAGGGSTSASKRTPHRKCARHVDAVIISA